MRTIHIAGLLILHAPGRNKNVFGVLGIDGDVIEHIVIATEVRQPRPAVSAVGGYEESSGAGAEVNPIGILRVEIQTSDVATIRPQGSPLTGPEGSDGEHRNNQCNQ
jgi:hypothetical protein